MGVSKGQASTEGAVKKLFIGIGSSYIVAVNPTKAELEKLYGRSIDKDPEYVGSVEVDGKTIPQVRLDFICKPDPEKYLDANNQPIDVLTHTTIFLRKQYKYGKNSGKYQIIDAYGRTAWATKEDIDQNIIPIYSNGKPANISKEYIPAYEGLEELTKLIRAYLNIPIVEKWENGRIAGLIDNPAEAEVMPEHIEDYFKGDFSELKEIFGYQPNNKVKIAYGVKTMEDGRQVQAVYTKMFLKNSVSNYSKLDAEIMSTKANGGLATTEFQCCEFQEYSVTPTNFEQPTSTDSDSMFNTESTPW